jgi:hypothetical protein
MQVGLSTNMNVHTNMYKQMWKYVEFNQCLERRLTRIQELTK